MLLKLDQLFATATRNVTRCSLRKKKKTMASGRRWQWHNGWIWFALYIVENG